MIRSFRLIAALLGLLAVPALAQTPQTAAPPTRPAPAAKPTPPTASTPAAAPAASVAAPKRIDINTASEKQLDEMPGVGPVRAKAIIAGRPYTDPNDIVTKKVLTAALFGKIRDRVALANINTSTAAEMEKTLRGIGDVRSKAIVAGRPYATPTDLVTKGILNQGIYDGIKDQITY